MKVVLAARERELGRAWEAAFHDVDAVRVHHGSILDVRAEALVSPANSFGYMDGGIDLLYSETFGWDLEARVRQAIADAHYGELPVGQAVRVPIGDDPRFDWLIAAPTMRVPMKVGGTTAALQAFRAVLHTAVTHGIGSVACPGLGTGVGQMPAAQCARQMRYAWSIVMEGHRHRMQGLAGAVRNHMSLVDRG